MTALAIFSFENAQVRTLGTPETPLFVAIDIAKALGFKDQTNAIKLHVDPEDLTKQEIETKGGRQTVNCVNESGLYALIFGSKLESAKRFKRWVTSEVLPAIRKTGQYQCPVAPKLTAQYLTVPHQYAIQSAVAKRVHKDDVSYQTVYQALKARFQVPKYTYILDKDFEAAVEFIDAVDLKVPEAKTAAAPKQEPRALPKSGKPNLTPLNIPEGRKMYRVSEDFLETQRTFVYCWRYLFRDDLELFYNFLKQTKSPLAPKFAEAIMDFNLQFVESSLAKLGFAVKDLECYKHWAAKRLTA